MSRSKQDSGTIIDWWLISVDKLKVVGLILVLVLVGGGAYLYRDAFTQSPKQRAESAIRDAEKALNDLAGAEDLNSFRSEFDRGQQKLAEARQLLTEKKYPEAEAAAIDSQSIVRSALARMPGQQDSDAQFLSVEGEVQYQHAGGSWSSADIRTMLYNGDWVKTARGASAEVIFANGSLYTVGPDALLEIYSASHPGSSKKQNSVKMEIGAVEVNTAGETSTVTTPGTQIVVGSASSAQVNVDKDDQTEIVALRGSSTVSSGSGQGQLTLGSLQKVTSTPEGTLSDVETILAPPPLMSPTDNQVFTAAGDKEIDLAWGPARDAVAYQLQVSRSRLFSTLEIDARRTSTGAKTRVTSEGSFYWRVASIGADGEVGAFSAYRRFRITGMAPSRTRVAGADTTPPALDLQAPFSLGGANYMISGKAEPGASVFVNDEAADVASDGTFKKLVTLAKVGYNVVVVKAVDPAGNQTVRRERVWVED